MLRRPMQLDGRPAPHRWPFGVVRVRTHDCDANPAARIEDVGGGLEIEHQLVPEVSAGQEFGLKVIEHAREHDVVYKVTAPQ